jgi:hypothetical protein
MPAEEIFRFVASFLGGGFVAAAGNWVYSTWSARRAREVEMLGEQVRLLYGPLFFLTSQAQQLFELTDSVEVARREFFEGKNWSNEQQTQDALSRQHLATIELKNAYVERVVKNNERVMDILERNWHLVDRGDIEILSRFQVDYTRYLVEERDQRAAGIPFSVRMKLGHVAFMHPDVIARVRATFERKQARFAKLTGVSREG